MRVIKKAMFLCSHPNIIYIKLYKTVNNVNYNIILVNNGKNIKVSENINIDILCIHYSNNKIAIILIIVTLLLSVIANGFFYIIGLLYYSLFVYR